MVKKCGRCGEIKKLKAKGKCGSCYKLAMYHSNPLLREKEIKRALGRHERLRKDKVYREAARDRALKWKSDNPEKYKRLCRYNIIRWRFKKFIIKGLRKLKRFEGVYYYCEDCRKKVRTPIPPSRADQQIPIFRKVHNKLLHAAMKLEN